MVRFPRQFGGSALPPRRRASLKRSLNAIERAFAGIEATVAHLTTRVRRVESDAASRSNTSTPKRRPIRITLKRRAQLKLQGAYMGYVRQLGPRQKARAKAVKGKRGFEAAIGVARKLADK